MANDKFILMGLDDERSKDVAEVLGNKTCRKIIDFLSEIKEASEKEISDGLKIPINTAEYNLNKLIKSGLVEKTKNFFWSRKGRKIEMYKLARKHIIISPSKKFDINILKAIIPVLIVAFIIIAFALYMDIRDIKNNGFDLRDNLKIENSTRTITSPRGEGATAIAETPPLNYADEKNINENYLKDKILIILEIILLLLIIVFIFIFILYRRKK